MNKLPEPTFHTIATLASRWQREEDQVINYMLTGQLKTSVISNGWWIESGAIEQISDHDFITSPHATDWSSGRMLTLCLSSVKKVLSEGAVENPSFQAPQKEYLRCSSNHYPSPGYPVNIVIKKHDLIFAREHVLELERGENIHSNPDYGVQLSHFSSTPKPLKLLQDDLLQDAMPIWFDFLEKNKVTPNKKATVKLLISKYPEKYGRHKASSLERHISLKALELKFRRHKAMKDKGREKDFCS